MGSSETQATMRLAASGSRRVSMPKIVDRARVGLEEPGDHAEDGGLAGAVGAEEGVELAGADLELEVLDDGAVEAFVETLDGEGEVWGRHRGLRNARQTATVTRHACGFLNPGGTDCGRRAKEPFRRASRYYAIRHDTKKWSQANGLP